MIDISGINLLENSIVNIFSFQVEPVRVSISIMSLGNFLNKIINFYTINLTKCLVNRIKQT